MTCTADYTPTFQKQLDPNDPYGGLNCAAYCGAMSIDYSSCGTRKPSGKQVRAMSSEPYPNPSSPGLNLSQLADVAARFGYTYDIEYGIPFDSFAARVRAGHYAILSVSYRHIRDSRFAGSTTFSGGHALGVPPGFEVQDPLADGRRSGIYRYQKEPYPLDLLRSAAEDLVLGYHNNHPITVRSRYGPGYVWAAFTPAHPTVITPPPPPPGPRDTAMLVTDTVGQDWTPTGTKRPVRDAPIRGAAGHIVGYVELNQIVRSHAEATTPDGNRWRLIEYKSKPGWLLRTDFLDVTKRGDPIDVQLHDYLARKP